MTLKVQKAQQRIVTLEKLEPEDIWCFSSKQLVIYFL